MKFLGVIVLIEILYLIEASLHTWGHPRYTNGLLKNKTRPIHTKLIEYNSTTPKNYTIIFRYYENYERAVTYIGINVTNTQSNGSIVRSVYAERRLHPPVYMFTAKINVNNTKNVLATLTIHEMNDLLRVYWEGTRSVENTKSLTFLYMNDAFPPPQPYTLTSIGKRQPGDGLLHFECRNIVNYNRFPSRAFSYGGKDDEYLTYVRFSFNSPTAMVFVDTSYVSEREFNAIAYDVNSEQFVANFSVFGVKSRNRPNGNLGFVHELDKLNLSLDMALINETTLIN